MIGGSGYGGAEMIRRLLVHPEVELARVASIDFVGEPLSAADPALEQVTDLVFEGVPPAEAARGADVVLLGLPHTVAAQKVPEIAALPGVKVVDMSGDFRLKDAAVYEKWYKHKHPCPERLKDFVYGLPELNRERIRQGRRIAAPGCFATTVELSLLPLARAGLLEGVVHVQGITGSSGSGVTPSAGRLAASQGTPAGGQTVSLAGITAGPGETQQLQVTAASDNTALIPNPTVSYASPNATGSLSYQPVASQHGMAHVTVTVRDENGSIVKSFTAQGIDKGDHTIHWDGTDGVGQQVPSGVYSISITAKDATGKSFSPSQYLEGKVEGVTYQDGIALLNINGQQIPLSAVRQVREG